MVLVLRAWGTSNLVLMIVVGGAFYVPLALLSGVVPREDLHHMMHALKSMRKEAA